MNEISKRLSRAVKFLRTNGFAKNDFAIAKKMGVAPSTLSMAIQGARVPGWDLLLTFCDNYPINFWWLRSGEGSMIRGDREIALLQKIEQLEKRIQELEGKA